MNKRTNWNDLLLPEEKSELTELIASDLVQDRDELKRRLHSDESTGLDFSPGDPVALAAYKTIILLENEIIKLEDDIVRAAKILQRQDDT